MFVGNTKSRATLRKRLIRTMMTLGRVAAATLSATSRQWGHDLVDRQV
ncbi:hypothetical protein SCE1572_15745 [Sorangium cellulosum So0157-2]|uniref:Uncharacterized protein n=1 Tax=Sorangium cellulosum So0157-2 TaxID=1254432 RepID=S4XTG3_SORCE|nr:hypothetical protein SCE1572_15745 [Sorangium cellulosum So0157-2]